VPARAAPRLYAVPALDAATPTVCAAAARLHFDWLETRLRDLDEIAAQGSWRGAAEAGLKRAIAIDAAALHSGDPEGDAARAIPMLAAAQIGAVRCSAAHHTSPAEWSRFLAAASAAAPDLVWTLDAIGATAEATAHLFASGFDWVLSSSKWWDGRAAWALDQYARFHASALTIGFPENLSGDRLRTELERSGADERTVAAWYRLRYAIAAFLDDGLLMPMGYEAALASDGLHRTAIDLRPQITAINRTKSAYFGGDPSAALHRLEAGNILVLVRLTPEGDVASGFIANLIDRGTTIDLAQLGRRYDIALDRLRDVTPAALPHLADRPFWLEEWAWRVFAAPVAVEQTRSARVPARRRAPAPAAAALPRERGARITIEHIYPEIDGGRYPIKRVAGDRLEIWADIFRDGHEVLGAALLLRREADAAWTASPMHLHENDRWVGAATLPSNARYLYCIESWVDLYAAAAERLMKNYDAGQDAIREIEECSAHLAAAIRSAGAVSNIGARLREIAEDVAHPSSLAAAIDRLMAPETVALMEQWGPRGEVTRSHELEVIVDRKEARFSAWYEMFPRSQGKVPGRSATFADCVARLDEIRGLGFDVIYFPPIHPIGAKNRKGRNNAVVAAPGDPGSPYAIGSAEGGHCAIHPELGTLAEFRAFVAACRARGMEVALDFAVQCAADHPWVAEHPEWFEFRADGSIRFAENPPKKYQDIVNVNFNSSAWQSLWEALRDVVLFWAGEGVRIFRVDNPHTKPFPFWEWLIRDIQTRHPDTIFLAEAFTRPKIMEELAKLGFTQSYTYFTWRNEKTEIVEYFTHLTQDEPKEYFRPQLFANTPDILPKFLQEGGAPAFRIRAALAATLGGLYGIYSGFELCENRALPNSEEYRDSEKYEYKVWDWDRPGNIKPFITRLNRIRHDNVAFEDWRNLAFVTNDNPRVVSFLRSDPARRNHILVAVSLDAFAPQSAHVEIPLARLELPDDESYAVEDLIHDRQSRWSGRYRELRLDPAEPAAILRLAHKAGA